jgi:hypothetical protein
LRKQLATFFASLAMTILPAHFATATDLYWEWSFTANSALQKGYFVTNGGPFTSSNPSSATYNVTNFIVSQSSNPTIPVGSVTNTPISTGGIYLISQPTVSFVWNNSLNRSTLMQRDNGTLTNGFGFDKVGGGPEDRWTFFADNSIMLGRVGGSNGSFQPLSLQAVTTPVPEPSTYALAVIATGVMAFVARRRKARLV